MPVFPKIKDGDRCPQCEYNAVEKKIVNLHFKDIVTVNKQKVYHCPNCDANYMDTDELVILINEMKLIVQNLEKETVVEDFLTEDEVTI